MQGQDDVILPTGLDFDNFIDNTQVVKVKHFEALSFT